jgi:[protein-PII] uridylyltransferase
LVCSGFTIPELSGQRAPVGVVCEASGYGPPHTSLTTTDFHVTSPPLQQFLDLRTSVSQRRLGNGGTDVCEALTTSLDAAIKDLAESMGPDAAVVALGGYGRREQCLGSDVDVMLVHRGGGTENPVRAVLYPLWDAGLKLGQAVRTIAECEEAAADFETLTSLLSARLVAGDAGLFDELEHTITEVVRKQPLASALVAQERIRRAADPYPAMAADLKEGRGALRTHQGFWWERRRAELLGLRFDTPSVGELAARETLLATRNALHAASGKATDRFVVDLREPAAQWLGKDVHTVASELTGALHNGDGLADQRWPDLHAEQDPMVGFGRRIFGAVRSRFSTSDESAVARDGVLQMAVAAAGRRDGAWFEPFEEDKIRSAPIALWTADDRTSLVALLSAGARGRTVFGRLEALGWVDREFPEWAPVATAPQLAPFHDHPVGAHLWRTADEMQALIDSRGDTGQIAEIVGSTEELLLAAFLHDIGKARGGNHAVVGAGIASDFLRRVGFGPATIGVVVDVVRLHLLLSETATRRDIDDPVVIDEVASRVGDLRRLDVLYLLTISDLRATGTTMWNEWRSTLIKNLYRRVREAIAAGGAPAATPNIAALLDEAGSDADKRQIEEHVAAMPGGYLELTPPQEILRHLAAADSLDGPAMISVDSDVVGRVLIVGADRSGFLLSVSRAFTAHGLGIMEARLHTRSDGIALDSFDVRDDRTSEHVRAEKWDAVAAALRASDSRDLRPAIGERVQAYRTANHDASAVEVRTGPAGRFTAIEVRAPDRIGLFNDIVEALFGEGLDIYLARVDTMGGEARDVFHVRQVGGAPIRDESALASLRSRLEDRLGG